MVGCTSMAKYKALTGSAVKGLISTCYWPDYVALFGPLVSVFDDLSVTSVFIDLWRWRLSGVKTMQNFHFVSAEVSSQLRALSPTSRHGVMANRLDILSVYTHRL